MADEQNNPTAKNESEGAADAQAAASEAAASEAAASEAEAAASSGPSGIDLSEAKAAYERARKELQENVSRLRAEMAKIDLEQAGHRAKTWVDDNPVLAIAAALGAGLLAGRLISVGLRPAPPPPLHVRAQRRALAVGDRVQDQASELADVLARRSGTVLRQAARFGSDVTHRAEDLADELGAKARAFSREAAQRAGETGEMLAATAAGWGDVVGERAEVVGEAVSETANRARREAARTLQSQSKALKHKANRGLKLSETLVDSARTLLAAVAVKKVSDWMRKIS